MLIKHNFLVVGYQSLLPGRPKIPSAAFHRLKDLHFLKPCRGGGLKPANVDSQKIPVRTFWRVTVPMRDSEININKRHS